jgi:GNAT superfamily N-acetyltransferase
MLVRLYALPDSGPALQAAAAQGVVVRRALVPEKPRVLSWVESRFPSWVPEVDAALGRQPVGCLLAVRQGEICGMACHDALFKGCFGPLGVAQEMQGRGLGRALLLASLHALREQGYAYAVIGGVGPAPFYARTVGAVAIEGSDPGPYAGMLRSG